MTKSNDKIIKVDFGNKQKTESIDNGLLDYFGFNEKIIGNARALWWENGNTC